MSDEQQLLDAIHDGSATGRGSGRPEAVLREHVQPVLESILRARGARSASRDELTLNVPAEAEAGVLDAALSTSGRADAVYNRFVIEFEPPWSLRPSLAHSATKHAVAQIQQYLRGLEEHQGLPLDRVAGCAFDGSWIVYVTWDRGSWRVARPLRVEPASLSALLATMESLASGRGLTAGNLDEDFGRDSRSARAVVRALFELFDGGTVSGRGLAMFDQWTLDLGNASGPFSTSDLEEWATLCDSLGVRSDEAASRHVLFCLQTYFALVAKLAALIILEGVAGKALVTVLSESSNFRQALRAFEYGELTAPSGATNVIEPGVFSWYLGEPSAMLEMELIGMAKIAAEYSAEVVEISPIVARDVLKDLYQRLLPGSIRHRLGEYYTPDWLAQRLINQVTQSNDRLKPTVRVLDPACGSGTFLVEVISRMVDTAGVDKAAETLERILDNVVGFDLSPLAVQAAKVNYLLALAPLMSKTDRTVTIPVFLADSVSPPKRGGLLDGDVFVLDSSEGEWKIPAVLADAHYLATLGGLLRQAVDDHRDRAWVISELKKRVPLDAERDQAVLDAAADLFDKLRDLDHSDRDGIWWSLIANAFAPTLQGRFDYVIGNPPWVSWETLPEKYRRENDDLWLRYGLRPDSPHNRRQPSAHVPLDLSMLFVARGIDEYLAPGGTLGFVITASVFRSELAGRGFRRRALPDGSQYRFRFIDDMSALGVFSDASNHTAVVVADRAASRGPIPVSVWLPEERAILPTDVGLEAAAKLTRRRDMRAEPVLPEDEASPLVVMPRYGLEASRPLRRESPYLELVRNGVHTRGANGIFFVEILKDEGDVLTVRNLASEGRNRKVPIREGVVERAAVRTLVRGQDVSQGAANPVSGLMFFHNATHVSYPMSAAEVAAAFPLAFEYMLQFEGLLRARTKFRNFDPTGDNWLGVYSVTTSALSHHKVVLREIANGLIAAPLHGERLVPDHKLYVIRCETAGEADRLSAVLNSRVVSYLVRAFSQNTSITGSLFRYVGIRDLKDLAGDLESEEFLAEAVGTSLDEYRSLDAVARTEMG